MVSSADSASNTRPGTDPGVVPEASPNQSDLGDPVPVGAVVVGVDGTDPDHRAVSWAAAEAARRAAPLHVLCARSPLGGYLATPPDLVATVANAPDLDAAAATEDAVAHARDAHPGLAITSSRPHGNPAGCLLEAAEQALLVVVGQHGLDRLSATVLGSTAQQVALHARCPVAVIDPERDHRHPGTPARVVVGVDGSVQSHSAVRYALEAAGAGGSVELVRAYWPEVVDGPIPIPDPDGPSQSPVADGPSRSVTEATGSSGPDNPPEAFADQLGPGMDALLAGSGEVTVTARGVSGRAAGVLAEAARDADLLVVASRGHGGFVGLLLGSVTQKLLSTADVPLVITRADES